MITVSYTAEEIAMKFVYYLQNGTKVDSLPVGYDKFYVAENMKSTSEHNRYFYPGDKVQYTLDNMCVELYDVFQDAIFPSRDDYYKNYGTQPQWIGRAGLDSDFDMPKDELVRCFSTPLQDKMAGYGINDQEILQIYQEIDAKKFRYAYTADCQSLVNTLQELIWGCHSSIIGFYKHLSSLHGEPQMEGTYYECSPESRMVYGFLYNFIIQSYSAFDILTKIAYELENLKSCEFSYAKLAASKILYGNKKDLKIDPNGTVFEKCRTTSIIENLRNELVHNATWEMNPKIFTVTDNGVIVSRHIFFPDFTTEGTLVTFKNRKRFFADGNKVNDVLPDLYFDVLSRVYMTLGKLIGKNYLLKF